ncbi:MAG: NAD(P)H-dependent oxidoreductase, partial [Pseudomonadota bacterium]
MSRKVIAFAASSSIESINKKLVIYAAGLFTDCEVHILDLNDFEMPLFSVDREAELGQPEPAQRFYQ